MLVVCAHCDASVELTDDASTGEVVCTACGLSFRTEPEPNRSTVDWQPTEQGQRLGRFLLLDQVGQGGFGAVYRARDTELNRLVAVKIPRANQLGTERADRDIFIREARNVASLRHPSIVPVFEVGEHEGLPYLVSEFVTGTTLADLLTSRQPGFTEAAEMIADLADALHHAHQQGVVHRDVKPANIMLDSGESASTAPTMNARSASAPLRDRPRPRLMDFGMAKREASESALTMEGAVLGTPAYMSPEQARGESRHADSRSDVYSLGVILFQLLTGELPFRGNKRMQLHQTLHEEPRPPRSLNDAAPRDLQTICLKAMAKEPSRRYQTAAELAADLRRYLNGEPIQARPVGALERFARWCRRKPAVAGLVAVSALALLVLSAGGLKYSLDLRQYSDELEKNNVTLADTAVKLRQERDLAEGRLLNLQQVEYATEMQRVASLWQKDPRKARQILDDPQLCPPRLHDFTWEMYSRLTRNPRILPGRHRGDSTRGLAFSHDGNLLASVDEGGQIKLWNLRTSQELRTIQSEAGPDPLLAFARDGRTLAATNRGSTTIHLLDVHTGGKRTLATPALVRCLAWSPDSNVLAVGNGNGIDLWEIEPKRSRSLRPEPEALPIACVAVSADGKRLLSGHGQLSPDGAMPVAGEARLWDLEKTETPRLLAGHADMVWSVGIAADGRTVTTLGRDGAVKLWNAHNGKELASVQRWNHHPALGAIDPEGRFAVVGTKGRVRCVEVHSRTAREVITATPPAEDNPLALAVSPEGRTWAAPASTPGGVAVWSILPMHALTLKGHTGQVYGLGLSSDGKRLVSASGDSIKGLKQVGEVKLWDLTTGTEQTTLDQQPGGFYAAQFSPDDKRIAATVGSGMVKVWDAQTGKEKAAWMAHSGGTRPLVFSPDGTMLASGGADGTVKLWSTAGQEQKTLPGHLGRVNALAFSSDGKLLAVAGGEYTQPRPTGQVKLWEVSTGRELADFLEHTDRVFAVAFSPDDKTLASVAFDSQAMLWDVPSRALRRRLNIPPTAKAVTFSPDGRTLAIGSSHYVPVGRHVGVVQLWDPVMGQMRASFGVHDPFIGGLAFDRAGRFLASAGTDGTLKLWVGTASPVTLPPVP